MYVDTGGVHFFDRFLVAYILSVPCMLRTEIIEPNIEAILTRLRKIIWQEHLRFTADLPRPTPMLICLNDNDRDHHWQYEPARVRACIRMRVKRHEDAWIMAECGSPGMTTITPNALLFGHKSAAVARGVAIVEPDYRVLVKLCNFANVQVIARKYSILGFAERFLGSMLQRVLDDNASNEGTESPTTETSHDQLEDPHFSGAPEHHHKQIRDMLKTHSSL